LQVVLAAPHMEPADTSVLRRFAADLVAAQADLLLWLGRAPPLEPVLAAGGVPPVVGSDGMENGIVEARDISRFRGVRFTRFIDPHNSNPVLRDFGRRYEAATGIPLNSEAVYVYDAIKLLASLIRAGADTREALRARLAEVGNDAPAYDGIGGVVAFDSNGDVRRPYIVALVTESGIVAATSE
jgi:ABC-type branched-subunit amino acid transport system substrate-binding protein